MNKDQFISYLEAPELLHEKEEAILAGVLKDFPYFQTARLLYTKSLHNQKSIHYNTQLKITAAYAADRKKLHRLITQPTKKEVTKELVKEKPSITVKPTPKPDIPITPIKEVTELKQEKPTPPSPAPTPTPAKPKEVLPEKADFVLKKEVIEKAAPKQKKAVKVEKEKEEHTFSDWLKQLSPVSPEAYHEPTEQEPSTINDKTEEVDKTPDIIIDKFIAEQPSMPKQKTKFFNPVDMAKQSVEEDITFVSETLANICLLYTSPSPRDPE